MTPSLAFLLGILATGDPPCVAAEDFAGEHGPALRLWQQLGFLASEPDWNPRASCPYCQEGTPLPVGLGWLCGRCLSAVNREHLLVWRFELEPFVRWLASALRLHGSPRSLDADGWQLGSVSARGEETECFFRRRPCTGGVAGERIRAYRRVVLLQPLPGPAAVPNFQGPCFSLLELFSLEGDVLSVRDLPSLLHGRGLVRFEKDTGELWLGDRLVGELPPGSKEHALLACLWRERGRYVPYRDLKRFVLADTGSSDSTEEATFCQRLKSRAKKAVPELDRLIATTNKADGYRLRSEVGEP